MNRSCADGIIHPYVLEDEMLSVIEVFHSSPIGRHNSGVRIAYRKMWILLTNIHQESNDFCQLFVTADKNRGDIKKARASYAPNHGN